MNVTTPHAAAEHEDQGGLPSSRLPAARLRLPNFIIGGAIKGGTTSLNYYLKQHPDVFMSAFKEPRYFTYDPTNPEHLAGHGLRFPIKTLAEYAALFADSAGYRAVGETSPHYLRSDTAPQLIAATIPDVRLIFSLRDPVRRAYSSYWHRVRLGLEDRPAEVVLQPGDQAVEHGLYHAWLTRWYQHFGPAQIKIVLFDDLVRDGLGVVADICRFLQIDDTFVPDLSVKNRGGAMKNQRLGRIYEQLKKNPLRRAIDPLVPQRLRQKMIETRDSNFEEPPPMPADLARRLYDYYHDEVERLESLIDRDLSNWKK